MELVDDDHSDVLSGLQDLLQPVDVVRVGVPERDVIGQACDLNGIWAVSDQFVWDQHRPVQAQGLTVFLIEELLHLLPQDNLLPESVGVIFVRLWDESLERPGDCELDLVSHREDPLQVLGAKGAGLSERDSWGQPLDDHGAGVALDPLVGDLDRVLDAQGFPVFLIEQILDLFPQRVGNVDPGESGVIIFLAVRDGFFDSLGEQLGPLDDKLDAVAGLQDLPELGDPEAVGP